MRKNYLMDRFMAFCYDLIFLAITVVLVVLVLDFLNVMFFNFKYIYYIIGIICFVIYIIEFSLIPIKLKGTLGKYLNDLKIESTSGRITFGRMLFREIIMKHIMYATVLGLIADIIFYIVKKQTMHDYFLKTNVLKKETIFNTKPSKKRFIIKKK